MKWGLAAAALLPALPGAAQSFEFFKVQAVRQVHTNLEVTVRAGERTRAAAVYAKVYYYDRGKALLAAAEKPAPVPRGPAKKPHAMPVFFEKNKAETLVFPIPENVLAAQDWRAVAVFGDALAAAAMVSPSGMAGQYGFPERPQVDRPARVRREAVTDPVVEHVVKTGNARQPQLTLFMRPPIGMTDMAEADGVLAVCLLADSVDGVRRQLQRAEDKDDVSGILRYAEKRKLVILGWGSRGLWNPGKNWDELGERAAERLDDTFDDVAAAWARGVDQLARRYGMPDREFLLWGFSGAAQYAKRLALRKPQYFLAAHVHIPSSFDRPTAGAARVLWCLTTGENESGYGRSLRFLSECRAMGYPILYKAVPGLGHQGHPVTDRLGTAFFDYALGLREEKREGEETPPPRNRPARPWPASFREPPFVGDAVNQQVFRADEAAAQIPEAFRVSIPTKPLADAWLKEK
jgi:predicted esterase